MSEVRCELELQRSDAAAPFVVVHARTLACASCHQPLQRSTIDGVELDECRGCGLVWLDEGELATLLLARTSWTLEALGPSPSPIERSECCPICSRPCRSFRFHAAPHVHVAACDGHGNWLDDWQGRELTLWARKEAHQVERANTTPYQRRMERFISPGVVQLVCIAMALGSVAGPLAIGLLGDALWSVATMLWSALTRSDRRWYARERCRGAIDSSSECS